MNLMMLLEMAASSFPERVAVQNGEDRLTFAELFSAAWAVYDPVPDLFPSAYHMI